MTQTCRICSAAPNLSHSSKRSNTGNLVGTWLLGRRGWLNDKASWVDGDQGEKGKPAGESTSGFRMGKASNTGQAWVESSARAAAKAPKLWKPSGFCELLGPTDKTLLESCKCWSHSSFPTAPQLFLTMPSTMPKAWPQGLCTRHPQPITLFPRYPHSPQACAPRRLIREAVPTKSTSLPCSPILYHPLAMRIVFSKGAAAISPTPRVLSLAPWIWGPCHCSNQQNTAKVTLTQPQALHCSGSLCFLLRGTLTLGVLLPEPSCQAEKLVGRPQADVPVSSLLSS